MSHADQFTPEARAKREQRRTWKNLPDDPLAKRASSAQFWKQANKTNPLYGLDHSRTLYHHPGFRRYLMPGLRAHIEAKIRAEREAYRAELHAYAEQCAMKKALKKQLANSPTGQLFEAAA